MATKTTNLNLIKPEADDFYDVEQFNSNADIIDSKIKETMDKLNQVNVKNTDSSFHSVFKLNKDENGIYAEIQFKRLDGTLYMKSVLSGGTSPKYSTRTITEYDVDGVEILNNKVFILTYDDSDNLVSEVVQ